MKKLIAVIIVICMLLSASACSAQSKLSSDGSTASGQSDSAERRVIGRITAIDGSKVTLNAMEMKMGENGEGFTRPERPEGDNGERPERPEGGNGERPEKPDGENFTPPDMPDGENFTPPDMPDGEKGERPRPSDSDMPSFAPPGGGGMFSGEGEEMTVDLSGVKIMNGSDVITVDILSVGDMITLSLDSSGNAVSASLFTTDGNWGGKKPGGSDGN